ncbi:MAG: hypothetical protein D5R97_02625 [Candidatus Syntrophonatronum acetioxidans]|uniref:SCP domain-containing protein n=1 Tax=Candidatus Syntrophonatronum acetioxidans TaxID=1795816 RepID=A0A424YGZ3_9FIRM|nr:MAG: hypothetical protein D5R97_02625 [Candidatus Syntrophonatronum acetioxidans]
MDYFLTALAIILIIVFFRFRKNVEKSEDEIKKEKYLNYAIIASLLIFTMVMIAFANRGSMNVRSSLFSNDDQVESEETKKADPFYSSEEEQVMVILVNQERSREGMPPLTLDNDLSKLARIKAMEMVELEYQAHESPNYGTPEKMVRNAGLTDYKTVGENFTRTSDRARNALDSIRDSSQQDYHLHREEYTHLGVGVVEVEREGFNPYRVYVLFFAESRES